MARTKGSFTLGGTLEIEADAPADARLQVKTKADLTASGSFPYKYVGMIVSVESEQKAYMLIGSDPTVLANWEEQGAGGGGSVSELTDVALDNLSDGQVLKYNATNEVWENADDSSGESIQVDELPTASADIEGKILQYVGETTQDYTNGYFYECVSDGEDPATYSWESKSVQEGGGTVSVELTQAQYDALPQADKMNGTVYYITDGQSGGGGGNAALESDVTSNMAVGAIPSGTTLLQGTSFTEFVQKLLITEIAPTTTFSASGSGVKEVGTSVTPTLTLSISSVGTGTPTAIKFYDGSTLLDTQSYVSGTSTYTFTMDAVTTTKTVKGVLEYTKSDTTTASIEKTATYTFVMASYYGAVSTAPTDKAGIIALTKNVKNTKALTTTFTLSNQRSCYCYPASFGNLTSIKDANNFEYLSSYTKTTVTVDDVSYNVYTLTDAVTASGFKQVYA